MKKTFTCIIEALLLSIVPIMVLITFEIKIELKVILSIIVFFYFAISTKVNMIFEDRY